MRLLQDSAVIAGHRLRVGLGSGQETGRREDAWSAAPACGLSQFNNER